ncbi:hypothetical protein CRM22_006690 [Opisthorchis felineus]|uniref:Activating signal cointegrator 1 complex subunit 3 n=1 Tax=Opisthorchis felineus TaxID=147828 RepID=A0A4S2LJP4_OPIFE|nr:hypothetical protein CRM22_006690 [Opisthorchis felineus]
MTISSSVDSAHTGISHSVIEYPRLSLTLRRFSSLAGVETPSSVCCSLEEKLVELSSGGLPKATNFCGHILNILPKDLCLDARKAVSDAFGKYMDSCLSLVGQDTVDPGETARFASVLFFAYLGPSLLELHDRGILPADFPRHSIIRTEQSSLLEKLGGSGATDSQKAWASLCISLGNFLTSRIWDSVRDELTSLMRRCRVAVEADSWMSLFTREIPPTNQFLAPPVLDFEVAWDAARISRNERARASSILFHTLFSCAKHNTQNRPDKTGTETGSAATEVLRLAVSQSLLSKKPTEAVDVTALIEELTVPSTALGMSTDQLLDIILELLKSSRSDDEIQNELCELMGWDYVDLVFSLLLERSIWVSALEEHNALKKQIKGSVNTSVSDEPSGESFVNRLLNDPASVAQSRAAKLDANSRDTANRLRRAMESGPSVSTRIADYIRSLPYVYDLSAETRDTLNLSGSFKLRLPAGTDSKQFPLWDHVKFPVPSKPPSSILDVPLVKISSLDPIGQRIFEGMEQLNLIQSIVYPVAYNTPQNLLVSAPTGAGKTNVALLTIAQLLRSHLTADSVLDLKAFKIVYLAPMKALAAEITATFSKRLAPLGLKVRECTGDMQLTKQEIMETQVLISTPEKWDVISRKGSGDATLVRLVKLLIIDEIHLLHEDRGAVIEVLVARTLRQVETSQTMIRLVGLSATLPNYLDVAHFLHVDPFCGLFYFDERFRPVPLRMSFIGVRGSVRKTQEVNMNTACYESVLEQLREGHQVMVFVHARGDTFRTARWLRDQARQLQQIQYFSTKTDIPPGLLKRIERSGDTALREMIPDGFACHHAGMLRADRSLVERMFSEGHIRVLVCTATLAWGVNLPAHAVIIKGTRVYKAEKSDFTDLDVLDVLQIFGRAGRPQFDTLGEALIITALDKLDHYLRVITNQHAIESTLLLNLQDHLNAEIALGTISNIDDAINWLKYTYLFVRLTANPMHYGVPVSSVENDPVLLDYLDRAVRASALSLDEAEMIRYEPGTGQLASTDRGRTASLFYIRFSTAAKVRDLLEPNMLVSQLFSLLSEASEFSAMKVRDEEGSELNDLKVAVCRVPIQKAGNVDSDVPAKVNALLQGYISRHSPSCHSLQSDMFYIHQNAGRLVRYLFELSLRQGWSNCAYTTLQLARMIEQRQWDCQTPLWQFSESTSFRLIERVDELGLSLDRLRETAVDELTHLLRYRGKEGAREVSTLAALVPRVQVSAETQPVTRTILRVRLTLQPDFTWSDRSHGVQQNFWIWIEDPAQGFIYHSEYWTLTKRMFKSKEPIYVSATIPIFEPFPAQYLVRVLSDQWLGADAMCPISFKRLMLPPSDPPHTDLLRLEPLPICALQNSRYELLYSFTHFNPIQTQLFHTLYHQDVNVLLGAPTGSGKTVAAELAFFRMFNQTPTKKCVYIAPLKALVRERMEDWSVRIGRKLGKRVVELTGDVTPDILQLMKADLIVTTPEKWDGISRSWQQRAYVRHIGLIVIDEIHLLGEERGPVLEVLVSRANYIASQLGQTVRIVGLSTALSNAPDLAAWLRVPTTMTSIAEVAIGLNCGTALIGRGLFNFRPSVRPVPLEVHIQGFPGRHYCPRMATMNKPIYLAVNSHSPNKPVLVFVSSRRQTRLTALDLVSYVAASGDTRKWLHMDPNEMDAISETIHDSNLRLTLSFGIGLHHAGLQSRDRSVVEELFVNEKIQILISTATLAWGVNFPAHLVVVKGTEYYDGQTKRYVDYPITDVLQMMGRAGRPQFDNQGKAVIMVEDSKKAFYKRFLYEPFPVESFLPQAFADHLNAEIVAGTVSTTQEALDYLTWTFFFRRLLINPSYYGLPDCQPETVSAYLSDLVLGACTQLVHSSCLQFASDQPGDFVSTELGRLASFYYLSHKTARLFSEKLEPNLTVHDLLRILASTNEYALLPVRHNEDEMNRQLAGVLPLKPIGSFECPHTKAHLLLQAHFTRLTELPVADYVTDTRSVLDQASRILQAMLDACAQCGWLMSSLNCLLLMQMVTQGIWVEDVGSSLLQLPGIHPSNLTLFKRTDQSYITCLPELIDCVLSDPGWLDRALSGSLRPHALLSIKQTLDRFPLIELTMWLVGPDPSNSRTQRVCREVLLDNQGKPTHTLAVFAETDYVLRVKLTRINPIGRGRHLLASSSSLVKAKTEGWVVVLGDPEVSRSQGGYLMALKRVSPNPVRGKGSSSQFPHSSWTTNLAFRFPALRSKSYSGFQSSERHMLTLFLMSTSYLGLDQQVFLSLDIICRENENNDGYSNH